MGPYFLKGVKRAGRNIQSLANRVQDIPAHVATNCESCNHRTSNSAYTVSKIGVIHEHRNERRSNRAEKF